jgi:hypothetical protein
VSKLEAAHAANILAVVQIIRTEHLLYGLDSFCEEAASPMVPSLTVLARRGWSSRAFVYDMPELVALVADCSLRTAVSLMFRGETVHTGGLF